MRLSTRGRYAVRAMIDLASYQHEKPVPRSEIAARQDISAAYIAQLFVELQGAGLVRGIKGPGGGYLLEKAPNEIRVGDIVQAVEGPVALVACVAPGGETTCALSTTCVARQLWQRASQAILDVLNGITLEDLRSDACVLDALQDATGDACPSGMPTS